MRGKYKCAATCKSERVKGEGEEEEKEEEEMHLLPKHYHEGESVASFRLSSLDVRNSSNLLLLHVWQPRCKFIRSSSGEKRREGESD